MKNFNYIYLNNFFIKSIKFRKNTSVLLKSIIIYFKFIKF